MFNAADLIHCYTRAEALADGVLVDVTAEARRAGIRIPTALTAGACEAFGAADPAELARLLGIVRLAMGLVANDNDDRLHFRARDPRGRWVDAWAHVGPGDDPAPVLTILLEGED